MVTEEGSEWVRGKQGREEVGENGSGRPKDESGEERSGEDDEKREGEQKKPWEEESREGMTAIMCLREWQPCMNIACVIREQRRWGLNGLLTRAPKYWQNDSNKQGRGSWGEEGGANVPTERELMSEGGRM